jgi:hypothetical protein
VKRRLWLVTLAIVILPMLVACGDDDDSDSDTGAFSAGDSGASVATSNGSSEPAGGSGGFGAPAEPDAVSDPDQPPTDDGSDSLSLQIVSGTRQIIYTSSMVVVVDDVLLATRQAQSEIAALGGLVFGQDTTTDPRPRTVLTFKVRPEDFDEALTRLAGLGELESQQTSADDVTERVVDLQSQIITTEASVERLRGFLEDATDLETVASLERELLSRETNLELLRGQLRTIQDQIALATIFLTLTEPEPPAPEAHVELAETAYVGRDDGARCPGDDELTVDEDEAMTICIVVENVGTLALTEIEIRDVRLDLDEDDFIVVEGSLTELEPEAQLIGYWETSAKPDRSPLPTFSAVPVDEDGDVVRISVEVDVEPLELTVLEDTSIPGFTDGLAGSWEALVVLGRVVVLAAGVAIPFLWLPVLVIGGVMFGGRLVTRLQGGNGQILPPGDPTAADGEHSEE